MGEELGFITSAFVEYERHVRAFPSGIIYLLLVCRFNGYIGSFLGFLYVFIISEAAFRV